MSLSTVNAGRRPVFTCCSPLTLHRVPHDRVADLVAENKHVMAVLGEWQHYG